MALRQFSEMYDLILPYVPAVELPLVDYHIRRVTREFTRRTTLWRRQVTITTQPGVNDYLLAPYDAAEAPDLTGGGSWVPLADQTAVTISPPVVTGASGGTAYATLQPDMSIEWANYEEQTDPMSWAITVTPPAPIRMSVVSFYESWVNGRLTASSFNINGGSNTYNLALLQPFGDSSGNFQDSFYPEQVGSDGSWNVHSISFTQGHSSETGSYVTGMAVFEVWVPASNPAICDPYSIISVTCNGKPIPPRPEEARLPHGARPANGKPNSWYSPSARVVHLYPTPDAEYEVVVDVVCALTMFPHNPVMPEFLFVDYREVIADGVVASLKMLGNKPWFDPEGAAIFGRRFASAVNGLRAKLRDGNQPNASVMRGPRFGK